MGCPPPAVHPRNFNGNPSDDSTEAIYERIGDRVPKGKLLFDDRTTVGFTETEKKLLDLCEAKVLSEARAQCSKMLEDREDDSDVDMSSCMLDMCFGANEHVLKTFARASSRCSPLADRFVSMASFSGRGPYLLG